MRKAYIFVDNLKVGGYQRLTLDQAYELSDMGFQVNVYALSPESQWDFIEIESHLVSEKNILIYEVSEKRFQLFIYLRKTFQDTHQIDLTISHSLRATLVLKLLKIGSPSSYTINTTLHQLPGLSHFSQRVKRFIYAQFSDNLFCFSKAAERAWYDQYGNKFSVALKWFTKEITTLRNGIYLNRLPSPSTSQFDQQAPRIIYLGRISFWKGLDTIKKLALLPNLSEFHFLLMVPKILPEDLAELERILPGRLEVIEGKSVSSLIPRPRDVHIYPANYGAGVSIIESISLNCLEMSAVGIPSLVSQGGLGTWPELLQSGIVQEVDWNDLESVAKAIKSLSNFDLSESALLNLRSAINIKNQLTFLLKN